MTAWTVATTMAYARPERRTRLLLERRPRGHRRPAAVHRGAAVPVGHAARGDAGDRDLGGRAGAGLGGQYGRRAGAIAALILSGCDFLLRSEAITVVLNGVVLLLLAGVVVGHLARLAAEVETRTPARDRGRGGQPGTRTPGPRHPRLGAAGAGAGAAAGRRGGRRGGRARPAGGPAGSRAACPWSGAPAGAAASPSGDVDLRALVLPVQSDQVTVSAPAQSVRLEKAAAGELTAAIRAALDNVRRHCGERARAWVLVEDEPGLVTVTVRDDGPGIADGRLAEAAAAGRLGVSHSICGRLRDLGGSAPPSGPCPARAPRWSCTCRARPAVPVARAPGPG